VDERVAATLAERENGSEPAWLTLSEAAEHLRVSESTVGRMLKQGRLRSNYIGRRRLVARTDLDSVSGSVSKR
jgi:excisionase family DNA binding protein